MGFYLIMLKTTTFSLAWNNLQCILNQIIFPGIVIDGKITWYTHIEHISTILSRVIFTPRIIIGDLPIPQFLDSEINYSILNS